MHVYILALALAISAMCLQNFRCIYADKIVVVILVTKLVSLLVSAILVCFRISIHFGLLSTKSLIDFVNMLLPRVRA